MVASAKDTEGYPAFPGARSRRATFGLHASSRGRDACVGDLHVAAVTANAPRAVHFTRATPGIPVALAGVGRREHVTANPAAASLPRLSREAHLRPYRQ
jgi:hypothetical protein